MTTRVSRSLPSVHYHRARVVETRMVAHGLASTVESAHQLLLRAHALMGPLGRCFVEARAGERALGFVAPFERALDGAPVPPVEDAAVAEEEADGNEDTARAIYRRDPTEAHRTAWRRAAHRHIARLTLLLRADEASA